MASKLDRRCPHFDVHDGVCGCPEFWQHQNHPHPLRAKSSASCGQNASNNEVSSSVSSIPPKDRTRVPQVTPAPSGPPKETCFFWYHGVCRRGKDCERPHEAHTTWPIPPPPGFHHFQPCTLPLCPLRTDTQTTFSTQESHRHSRNLGGQMDGTVFSHVTTSGESSSDEMSDDNTHTDMTETDEAFPPGSSLGPTVKTSQGAITHDADLAGKVKEDTDGPEALEQSQGRNELDKADYIDLSRLPSITSTPLAQQENITSISHPGTFTKRRRSLATDSHHSNDKRVRVESCSSSNFANLVPIPDRPRNMSQWEVGPSKMGAEGHHSKIGASYLDSMQVISAREPDMDRSSEKAKNLELHSFNPPEAPRSMGELPLICFFYYHKGYCNPKRGRRCDYLHDRSTSQQKVSLPHCIDNHDPSCSLPLCPMRQINFNQIKQELKPFATPMQQRIKSEPVTPPGLPSPSFHDSLSSSSRNEKTASRGRAPRVMLAQPLPQLTGLARQRYKEQRSVIQAERNISPTEAASTESLHTVHVGKRARRRKRGPQKRVRAARARAREGLYSQEEEQPMAQSRRVDHPDELSKQQPLPLLGFKEGLAPNSAVPVNTSAREPEKTLSAIDQGWLPSKERWLTDCVHPNVTHISRETQLVQAPPFVLQDTDVPTALTGKYSGVKNILEMEATVYQYPHVRKPSIADEQWGMPARTTPYEYSQECLGWTAEERRAKVDKEKASRRQAYDHALRAEDERRNAISGEWAYLPATGVTQKIREEVGIDTVEYRAPGSDERLDWDTDLVRRLFGEIE